VAQAKRGLDRLYDVLRDLGDAPDGACVPGLLDAFEMALEDDLGHKLIKRIPFSDIR
jgi:hypothetical protein